MINEFFGKCKHIFIDTVNKLKGSNKRIVLASTADEIGKGGQSIVAKEFKVSRDTIRKGKYELDNKIRIADNFSARGRKKIEDKLPTLIDDIKNIVDSQSQTDPNFKTRRLFTRLTVEEIKEQLISQKNYTAEELPTNKTLNNKINNLGYTLKKVRRTKPLKKIPETDAIFENIQTIDELYKDKDNVAIISFDAKNKVNIGEFSRGGYTRAETNALDHEFVSEHITPFGILDLQTNKVHLDLISSKVTADCIVDSIEKYWISTCVGNKDTLVIKADNGPENHSRRTQFIKRIVEFSAKYNVKIIFAYYPPYHSKYNPIERVWGKLEQHWNGSILESEETVIKFVQTMTWKGVETIVKKVDEIYESGKKLSKKIMDIYEQALERDDRIGKWALVANPQNCNEILHMVNKV